jgi:arylsulfatase A-like enzyme
MALRDRTAVLLAAAIERIPLQVMRRIWSVLTLLSLLLAGGVPALVQAATVSGGNDVVRSMVQNSVPVIDLAAAALNPSDLDGAGLPGYGQQSSVVFEEWNELAQSEADLGPNGEVLQSVISSPEFARGFQRELGLAARPGVSSSKRRSFVSTLLLQFANPEAAATAFAALAQARGAQPSQPVAGVESIGDESQFDRYRALSKDGDPYQAESVKFRTGALVAIVAAAEFGSRQPVTNTGESLGLAQFRKLQPDQRRDDPNLGSVVLRLGGGGVETRSDEYGRLNGTTFPNYSESADELAKRNDRYGSAIDVYGVGQAIAAGSPATTDDVRYSSLLYRFADEDEASAWLRDGVARAAGSPNIVAATPVEDASVIGDASLTIAIATARGGAGTARGYLIDTRVGEQVAQLQMIGIPDVPQAAVEDLARKQAACLLAGACPERAQVPADLPSAASPVAGTPISSLGGEPESCAEEGQRVATPVATPQTTLTSGTPSIRADPPNIIFILTDDLDERSVACMPNVQSLLADQGATFTNYFITTPLCCPSRSSILRGQYAHNHGVLTNSGNEGGFPAFYRLGHESSTVATWLQDAGYRTGLLGKYLNRYPRSASSTYIPPGWDDWQAFVASTGDDETGSFYTGYSMNENGTLVSYGHDPKDYSTDVLRDKATSFIEDSASTGRPFFLYLAPYAPHGPSTPASRHTNAFLSEEAPRVPSFDEADVSDKPAWVRSFPELSPNQIALIDERYRRRLRSLLAVDEMVASLIQTLEETGSLDNTYIVFSSDNGYHLGEHRLPVGKSTPYDESVRVPLIVRGPGVPAGVNVDQIALNIDLAPTFAELAGATPADFVDGRSIVPLMEGQVASDWRRGFLIEHFVRSDYETVATPVASITEIEGAPEIGISPIDAPHYAAVRTPRYLYVEYGDGERELYDLQSDPYALQNEAATADPSLEAELSASLAALEDCAESSCREAEDAVPAGEIASTS